MVGGDGPPVLLLYGYPQTHVMWHLLAPALAERPTVVAADQVDLMGQFGFDRLAVVGHDPGARASPSA